MFLPAQTVVYFTFTTRHCLKSHNKWVNFSLKDFTYTRHQYPSLIPDHPVLAVTSFTVYYENAFLIVFSKHTMMNRTIEVYPFFLWRWSVHPRSSSVCKLNVTRANKTFDHTSTVYTADGKEQRQFFCASFPITAMHIYIYRLFEKIDSS